MNSLCRFKSLLTTFFLLLLLAPGMAKAQQGAPSNSISPPAKADASQPAALAAAPASTASKEQVLRIPVFSEVKVYNIGVDFRELRDDWSKSAEENIIRIISEELKSKEIELTKFELPNGLEDEFEEIKALYWSVSGSKGYRFPEGNNLMEFTLGPIQDILKESGAEYVLLVHAGDSVATEGRTANKAIGTLLGVHPMAWGDFAYTDLSLISSAGKIVWHRFRWSSSGYDLRDAKSVDEFLRPVLKGFSLRGK